MKYIYIPALFFLLLSVSGHAQPSTSHLQIIHASADPTLPDLDLWVGNKRIAEHFKLGDATPILDVPADSTINIKLYPAGKSPEGIPYMGTTARGNAGEGWAVVLTGLVNEGEFDRNPDGWYTFFIFRQTMSFHQRSASPNKVELSYFHSVTDAPSINIVDDHGNELAKELHYGQSREYTSLNPGVHTFTLKNAVDQTTVYGTYTLDLGNAAGKTAILMLAGFLRPATNKNGPPLAVSAILSDGTVIPLSAITSVTSPPVVKEESLNVYPTPVTTSATLSYSLESTSDVKVELYNMAGQQVFAQDLGIQHEGDYASPLNVASLSSGIYRAVINTDGHMYSKHFMIVR